MAQMLGLLHYAKGNFFIYINIIIIRTLNGSDAPHAALFKAAIFFISYYNYNKKNQWLRCSACCIMWNNIMCPLYFYNYYYYNKRIQWLRCSARCIMSKGNNNNQFILLYLKDSVAQMLGLLHIYSGNMLHLFILL